MIVVMFFLVHSSSFAAVSYIGPAGTYAEEAALKYFGAITRMTPFKTVQESINEVLTSRAQFAVVPVENTISGLAQYVPLVMDDFRLVVAGEIILPARHMLLGVRDAQLSDIKTILSYPTISAQSSAWLRVNLPDVEILEVSSTAEGSRIVSETGDRSIAVIATERAAAIYNLNILANDIQNNNNNANRFWVVTTQNNLPERGNKAALLAEGEVRNLHRLLAILDREGLEVLVVHSYPTGRALGQYRFLIEVVAKDTRGRTALSSALVRADQAQRNLFRIRIIGIYNQAV